MNNIGITKNISHFVIIYVIRSNNVYKKTHISLLHNMLSNRAVNVWEYNGIDWLIFLNKLRTSHSLSEKNARTVSDIFFFEPQ